MRMKKILFVCHGNICRSPMAEFILRDMITQQGIRDIEVSSAATSTEEIGNGVYPPVRRLLAGLGIDTSGKTARQIRPADYAAFDLIIGMDHANIRNMHRVFGGDPEDKIRLLLSFAGCAREVADPWYSGEFDVCLSDIRTGCEALLAELLSK